MHLAKEPNNDADWKSLDIYIFSNGQQQTPPRKYHLQTEELIKWEATLKSLADSQYGNNCSIIHLYTTDGHKIESPVEIKNEIAYVAVLSEDAFIYAGYNEYLLKASRSREKRLEKSKLPNYENLQSGKNIHNKYKAKGDTERNKKSDFGITDKNRNSRGKQRNLLAFSHGNSHGVNGKTQAKKIYRNSSSRQNYSAILPTVITRNPSQSKKSISKKMFNTTKPDIKAPIINNYLTKRTSNALTEIDHPDVNSRTENINNISLPQQSINAVNDNIDFTDTGLNKINIKEDDEMMKINTSNILEATLNTTQNNTLFIKTILSSLISAIPTMDSTFNTNLQKDVFVDNFGENNGKSNTVVSKRMSVKNEDVTSQEPNKNEEITAQQTINFISIVDKEDVIDLKLRMEIRKGDALITARCNTNGCTCLNEISSQVEIDEVFSHSLEEEFKLTDTFKDYIQIPEKQKCACCEYYDFDEIMHTIDNSENLRGKKIVFLVNDPRYGKCQQRCSCDQEIIENNIRIKDLNSLLATQSKRVGELINTAEHNVNIESVTNAVRHSQNSSLGFSRTISNDVCLPNNFHNNSTQTEWSSLLVEARYHGDNRYTFHLPSLRILKEYFS